LNYEYIMLAPGYAKEALEAYDTWENKEKAPMKVQELMMVLRIEVSKRYGPPWEPEKNKLPILKDTKLG
jgi:hypothetical protein